MISTYSRTNTLLKALGLVLALLLTGSLYAVSPDSATLENPIPQDLALPEATPTSGNLPPVCQSDSLSTTENTELSVYLGHLLGNDSDPDDDPISLHDYDLSTAQGGTNDTGHIGGFNYTPPTDFTGTDWFNYTVSDTGGLTDSCTVFVTVSAP